PAQPIVHVSWSIASGRHHETRKLHSPRPNQFDRLKGQERAHTMAMQNISFARRVYFLKSMSCTFLNGLGVLFVRSLSVPWYFHGDNTSDIVRKAINVRTVARCAAATIRK